MSEVIPAIWLNNDLKMTLNKFFTENFIKLSGFEFSYSKNWVNDTLFTNYLWMEFTNFDSIEEFISEAKISLENKKEEFCDVKEELKSFNYSDFWWAKDYIDENIENLGDFFELLGLYIEIEAEKIEWYNYKVDNLEEKIKLINELEANVYWERVSDSKYWTEVLNSIKEKFELANLNDEEIEFMNTKIFPVLDDKTENNKPENENISGNVIKENIWWQNDKSILSKKFKDAFEWSDLKIMDKEIPREDYIEIFELSLDVLWLEWYEVVLTSNSNVSINKWKVNIPDNADYAYLKISRIIALISHELEVHAITNANNDILFGWMKSLSYIWREEWTAHVMEHLAQWYWLDDIPTNRYLPRMLVWELVNGKDFKKFLHIMNKLDWQTINVDDFFTRFKRWKNIDLPWVNPKEKLYWIWAFQVIDYLKEGKNPLDLFLAKHWFSEQSTINSVLLNEWETEINPDIIAAKWMVFPLFLSEMLRYKLLSWDSDDSKWLAMWGFIKYFNWKYGEIFSILWINTKDFVRNLNKANIKETKCSVTDILNLLNK